MFNTLVKYGEWKWPNPVLSIELIKASERELSYLTKDKIQPFLNKLTVDKSPKADQVLVVCKICLATGARVAEALGLKRSVPISKVLHDEILAVAVSGHAIFDVRYYAAWECVKRSLPAFIPRGQATHILRHTFASHFMMNGGDILVLQRILGHSKIEQTMAYAHFFTRASYPGCRTEPVRKLEPKKWRQSGERVQ